MIQGTRIVGFLALMVAAGGCNSGPPPLAPVKGRVIYNGKPLAQVRVEFVPEQMTGEKYLRSMAVTDADGNFELVCDDGRTGAVIGWHRVVIASAIRDAKRDANPFEPEQPRSVPAPGTIPLNLSPYLSVATTRERQEVKPGENTMPLNLRPQ